MNNNFIDKEYVFRYILSKKPNLLVSRRDFVLAATYEKNEDESYNIVFVSIDDLKIKSDAVRALVNIIIEFIFCE